MWYLITLTPSLLSRICPLWWVTPSLLSLSLWFSRRNCSLTLWKDLNKWNTSMSALLVVIASSLSICWGIGLSSLSSSSYSNSSLCRNSIICHLITIEVSKTTATIATGTVKRSLEFPLLEKYSTLVRGLRHCAIEDCIEATLVSGEVIRMKCNLWNTSMEFEEMDLPLTA